MAQKAARDWIYLVIISLQLIGMICLEFTEFYPDSIYSAPNAPLHFLVNVKEQYLSFSGDPFFGDKFHGAWFRSMFFIEIFVQFPLAIYIVRNLAAKKPSSGPAELAGLAYGCLTAMSSVACVAELLEMGPELVSEEHKRNLVWGTYFPYALIPGAMAVDMYARLLRRVSTDTKPKTQ
ncbi:hypothetical protein FVEG_06810 [Fusarium verticillioides 7600]|uniref:Efficient mitochondria targeting-associated protein 19 n=2 Tax=Fusarium TaxID=5506 RepID=W7M5H0_GIBM7|nr:hypothetical protein FVEG_06810 [Fusarium verticillioides 7600]XP_044677662.1 hypothetical protein J7337_009473 [Fusarium musae]RBQ77620.1 hypothetical protein FVER14953_06810 [Fusarium verticillioides]EWG46261.1 hypothetical protein FVEG_06810 [Fusarium verticillioides 7600]KAG9498662.1 hypothetical protein J7337_009473 [Fusarium musae]RBR03243.1 hypothetical protein FVER53590_06810 [Fusarium verticillioides]